jgi:hypothetical protein
MSMFRLAGENDAESILKLQAQPVRDCNIQLAVRLGLGFNTLSKFSKCL